MCCTYGTISSRSPERNRTGTSVMVGIISSLAQSWWQSIARYFAGGITLCMSVMVAGQVKGLHTKESASSCLGMYSPILDLRFVLLSGSWQRVVCSRHRLNSVRTQPPLSFVVPLDLVCNPKQFVHRPLIQLDLDFRYLNHNLDIPA